MFVDTRRRHQAEDRAYCQRLMSLHNISNALVKALASADGPRSLTGRLYRPVLHRALERESGSTARVEAPQARSGWCVTNFLCSTKYGVVPGGLCVRLRHAWGPKTGLSDVTYNVRRRRRGGGRTSAGCWRRCWRRFSTRRICRMGSLGLVSSRLQAVSWYGKVSMLTKCRCVSDEG